MDSSKLARAIGHQLFHAWPYHESLVPTHPEWHFERTADEPGSRRWLAEVLYRNPLRA